MFCEVLEVRRLMSGPPVAGNWKMVFDSDGSAWSGYVDSLWGMQYGTTPANVAYGSGGITLTATKSGSSYLGGELSTGGDGVGAKPGFSFEYGYVQATMKMPAGEAQGLWESFWMLPTPDPNYHDTDGEIDISEVIDGQNMDNMHLHHQGYTTLGKAYASSTSLSAGYNTYGVDWEPGAITWYLNGQAVFSGSGSIVPDVAEYLILSLWVGGSWPGSPSATTVFPNTMQISSVQVWQHGSSPLAGDANGDGVVDGADFSLFDNEYNSKAITESVYNADIAAATATLDSESWSGPVLTIGASSAAADVDAASVAASPDVTVNATADSSETSVDSISTGASQDWKWRHFGDFLHHDRSHEFWRRFAG